MKGEKEEEEGKSTLKRIDSERRRCYSLVQLIKFHLN
jgi:hypothetical protein